MRYGIATMDEKLTPAMRKSTAYSLWNTMIARCYGPLQLSRRPTYEKCTVCEDWLVFSKFKAWLGDRETAGLQLDKDLKYPDNTVYGPEFCVFIPACINSLFNVPANDSIYPLGVRLKPKTGKYYSAISYKGKDKHLGYFITPEEAEAAYREAKLKIIAEYKEIFKCPDIQQILNLQEKNFR